ncbi:hypothetical protein J1N35_036418 [Gossypium stocksii]|uniref:RNase H type-1 domain-containing protein n=1 Tax=Gossypium stocksii TaxID=47602 RepID=A0A9D3ZKP4_9ROSI|nr:hypothetical protein J1N35_036418 [Gossypium stocksii]
MVGNCKLNDEVEDRRIHDKGGVFSIKKLSQLLAYDGMEVVEFPFDRIWSLKVPAKVKYNVARVVVEEVAGCEGVLRDEKGVVFALFSGKCGTCGVEQAVVMAINVATKVMAIKVATEIFIDLTRKVNVPLIIEFELSSVSDWLKYRRLRPWSVRKLFVDIEGGLRHLVEIKFVFTNSQKNGMTNYSPGITFLKLIGNLLFLGDLF